jgi:hypothetical protein
MIRQTMVMALALGAFVFAAEAQPGKRRTPTAELSVRGLSPDSGAPGTTVTLRGTFPGDAKVVIGGRTVDPSSVQPRRLQFVVPDVRPGAHKVTVRASRARVEAGSFRVERERRGRPEPTPVVQPAPEPAPAPSKARRRGPAQDAPVISGFAPRSGPAGTDVTIRGRNLDAAGLEVVVGGQVVKPTRSSARAITFKVPKRVEDGTIVLRRSRRPNVVVGTFEVAKKRPQRRAKRYEDHRKQAEIQWKSRRKELARAEAERLAELRRQEEELQRSREERRRQRAAALAAAHERQLRAQADVQAELALNAERTARLDRMLRLAEAHDDGRLVVRIRVLQRQEADRHEQRMNDLRLAFRSR